MSESGDDESGSEVLGYLNIRSSLLLNMSLLRQELNWLWEKEKKFKDKQFDGHLHTIAERKRELLDIAHSLMSPADYEQYKDLVNNVLKIKYSKFSFQKMKKINKDFSG